MIHRFSSSDLGGGCHWNSMGNQGEKYTMSKENEGKYRDSWKFVISLFYFCQLFTKFSAKNWNDNLAEFFSNIFFWMMVLGYRIWIDIWMIISFNDFLYETIHIQQFDDTFVEELIGRNNFPLRVFDMLRCYQKNQQTWELSWWKSFAH